MRKIIAFLSMLVLVAGIFGGCGAVDDRVVINVYNWGQYISEGQDDTIDVIAEFENVHSKYGFASNSAGSTATMGRASVNVALICAELRRRTAKSRNTLASL